MNVPFACLNEQRREAVRKDKKLHGLDYLEVEQNQRALHVYFLGKAPKEWRHEEDVGRFVRIEGGRRIQNIRVVKAIVHRQRHPDFDDYLEVTIDRFGDFSPYTLRVVVPDEHGGWQRHPDFDPLYDRIEFSFKVDCPSDLDCRQEPVCPPKVHPESEINYLAKDYASFRQLILDRLALNIPDWQERHVPDIGIALVEAFAYAGDYLSYYQDAVATEAYLDTARQRISVRRHARLVDYFLHEGCNARAWVCVETESDLILPGDAYFITALDDPALKKIPVVKEEDLPSQLPRRYEIYEPMRKGDIALWAGQYEIHFYTWGNTECCLPRGATRATLDGELVQEEPQAMTKPGMQRRSASASLPTGTETAGGEIQKLKLAAGDVLIFEEVIGPKTGAEADKDPARRHAIRLTSVEKGFDPLRQRPVVEIAWAAADALPFPLCISVLGPPPKCEVIPNVSVARGNVVLVDHGQTVMEPLDPEEVPAKETIEECECEGVRADSFVMPERYRPRPLKQAPLTFSQPLQPDASAARMMRQDPHRALPAASLQSTGGASGDMAWTANQDLLDSRGFDQHFVVEIDTDGRAQLRFGDGELGRKPAAGSRFQATYRVGNGPTGNVGADSIAHLVFRTTSLNGSIKSVRNPLPARGGRAPESQAEAKLLAPRQFRTELKRAITAEDYAMIVERDFGDRVQRAAATLRWTGSTTEILVAVDPLGREQVDVALFEEIAQHLHRFRRINHDVVVQPARRVPLDIELLVCVLPSFLRGHVQAALIELFSNRLLPDGRRGYFHPDELSFGEGVYLSALVAAAQAVPGVESVVVKKLERLFEGPADEIENGVLPLGPFEIAQLENDPSFPEHGRLTLDMRGGR